MKRQIITGLKLFMSMTILTGVIYPVLVTGLARLFFKDKSNGSLVERKGVFIGSELIAQKFDSEIYFWPRPSAIDYNPLPSGASNLGPLSQKLKESVNERKEFFINRNMIKNSSDLPSEMLFASGSGLDPHISPQAALMQANRVAKARRFTESQKEHLIDIIQNMTEKRQFSLLGEERINVFILNLKIDSLK